MYVVVEVIVLVLDITPREIYTAYTPIGEQGKSRSTWILTAFISSQRCRRYSWSCTNSCMVGFDHIQSLDRSAS